MAHNVEPMDIDSSVCEFDNKENSFHHNNVLPRTPCTEKGYEELDVSELNMKLRYSITPTASPMSKSYTANCMDNRNKELEDLTFDIENGNMSKSLHSTLTQNDTLIKSQKSLPFQETSIAPGPVVDGNRSVLRPLDTTVTVDNIPIVVTCENNNDEHLSLPSSSSSMSHTPEATTPTKELPQTRDGGSPIMRGLKNVLNMFRPSQSPIPTEEEQKPEVLSPPIVISPNTSEGSQADVVASTPLAHKTKDPLAKKSSSNSDSLTFNEDLEKELRWKDETTILFSKEKIPIHKLFFQPASSNSKTKEGIIKPSDYNAEQNDSVEYMDISYNDSMQADISLSKSQSHVINKSEIVGVESDSEFVDCESTFTKNESYLEDSFKSQNDEQVEQLQATEANENTSAVKIMHPEELNDTSNTLVSGDVTTTSIETGKSVTSITCPEVLLTPEESEAMKKEVANEHVSDVSFDPTVSAKVESNVSGIINAPINDKIESGLNISNTEIASNVNNDFVDIVPTTENIVVKSISQIPLIADPRVLLFNLSPSVTKCSEETSKEIDTTPADIPLPDDDDISSLPVESTTVNNINQELIVGSNVTQGQDESVMVQTDSKDTMNRVETVDNTASDEILQEDTSQINDIQSNIEISPSTETGTTCNYKDLPNIFYEMPNVITNQPTELMLDNSRNETEPLTKPMDISMTVMPDVVQITTKNEEVPVHKTFVTEVGATSEQIAESKQVQEQISSVNDIEFENSKHVAHNREITSKNSQELLNGDILLENIKQEVEAIVAEAVDIVTEKAAERINHQSDTDVIEIMDMTKNVNDSLNNTEILTDTINSLISDLETSNNTNIKQVVDSLEIDQDLPKLTTEIPAGILPPTQLNKSANSDTTVLQEESLIQPVKVENEVLTSNEKLDDELKLQEREETNVVETSENRNPEVTLLKGEVDKPVTSMPAELGVEMPQENNHEKVNDVDLENQEIKEIMIEKEEEITVSGNNSPFVSLSAEDVVHEDELREHFEAASDVAANNIANAPSPPLSPKIVSKGYNFNFDDIEDPFATKTKIRTSPTPSGPNQTLEQIDFEKDFPKKETNKTDRRKLHSQKKRQSINNKRNSSISANKSSKSQISAPVENEVVTELSVSSTEVVKKQTEMDINEMLNQNEPSDTIIAKDVEPQESVEIKPDATKGQIKLDETITKDINCDVTSSSSTYFSVGTSSNEGIESKNCFNLPEIEDPNFNPFVTKSRVCQTPPRDFVNHSPPATKPDIWQALPQTLDITDAFATKNKILSSLESSINTDKTIDIPADKSTGLQFTNDLNVDKPEQTVTESAVKESMENTSANTCTSNEDNVKTEDEDTVEGPFLETDDLCNDGKISDFCGDNMDMMQFSDLPPGNEENADAGELFIDAEAFEFLLNQNNTDTVLDSGKESLFLKFDPLFAKRMSAVGMAALNHSLNKKSTPKKRSSPLVQDATFDISPAIGACNFNVATENIDPTVLNTDTKNTQAPLVGDATFDISLSNQNLVMNTENMDLNNTTIKQFDSKTLGAPLRDETFDEPLGFGSSTMNVTQEIDKNNTTEESIDDLNITVAKPMMVVNPAVNPVVTPRNKSLTPVRTNRQSLTFTSPAIAVIDRLLSMSGINTSLAAHDTTIAEVRRDTEADLALTQLRELLADKEISVYNMRSESKELRDRLSTMESQMKSLEAIGAERLKKINELSAKLDEKTKINKSMEKVVEEYEKTIACLIAETEQDRRRNAEERIQLIKERDEQSAHLASMEVSFSDLHSKYEKSKQVILGFKANEDAMKKSIKEFEENLAKMQNNYELLKQHATSKLNHANEELQKINRAHEAEVLKLNAMIKRKEVQITSLEETLQQTTKANKDLTAICDDLINKVG